MCSLLSAFYPKHLTSIKFLSEDPAVRGEIDLHASSVVMEVLSLNKLESDSFFDDRGTGS